MAKDKPHSQAASPSELQSLAERLFVQNWQPGKEAIFGKSRLAFAAMCFQGAQEFLDVSDRIHQGESPESIISPAEKVNQAA